jgi:hypothetical protein
VLIRHFLQLKQFGITIAENEMDKLQTIDDIIVEGDRVAVRFTMTGTYIGKTGRGQRFFRAFWDEAR